MTIKHDINEEIYTTRYRILYPCSTDNRLRQGFYRTLQAASKEPKLYTDLAARWEEQGPSGQPVKQEIFAAEGFLWATDPKQIVVIPVKNQKLGHPTLTMPVLVRKLLAACKRYGCPALALSRAHWRNMRYDTLQIQALIDGLEQGGIDVHEYE